MVGMTEWFDIMLLGTQTYSYPAPLSVMFCSAELHTCINIYRRLYFTFL